MIKRVLFVDDEPNILEGLRHRLHRLRTKWQMHFASSGAQALEILSREPMDVIVSDMRMPEMDGAMLLEAVKDRYPQIVRIVLTGHAEAETAMRAVPVTHQFLMKPSEPGVIENVIERACNLQALINEEVVQRVIGRIDRLPPVPRVYSQLIAALAKENTTGGEVAAILKQDMAMCAKTLQIVNSAYFGLARSVSTVEEAVTYLGFTTIKQIALAVEVYEYSGGHTRPMRELEQLQAHALAVGSVASTLLGPQKTKDDGFIAGLLHDIGKLVIACELPEHYQRVITEMRTQACPMHTAELQISGVTHAEVGAYLLGLWGLPYPIVEAVANHHAPARVDTREFGILAATHVANGLVAEVMAGATESESCGELDLAYVEGLGVTDKLPEWRALAERAVAAV